MIISVFGHLFQNKEVYCKLIDGEKYQTMKVYFQCFPSISFSCFSFPCYFEVPLEEIKSRFRPFQTIAALAYREREVM